MQKSVVPHDVFVPNLAWRVCFLVLTGLVAGACAASSLASPSPGQLASITTGTPAPTVTLNLAQFTATRTSTPTLTVTPNHTSTPLPGSPVPTRLIPVGDLPGGLIAFIGIDRQLWLMESNGQNQRQLTLGAQVQSPAWSPDGKTLGYIREVSPGQREAILYDLDTQRRYSVTVDISDPWFYEVLYGLT